MYKYQNRTIETERLLLRLHTPEDAEDAVEICNDFSVHKATLGIPFPYTKADAEKWIGRTEMLFEKDIANEFAVILKETGKLIGCAGLHCHEADKNGELYYWFHADYRGFGYATEAVSALIRYAFTQKGYKRVYAGHFANNPASGRVMQKCGMNYEGTQKAHILKLGKFEDLVLYGIVRPEE